MFSGNDSLFLVTSITSNPTPSIDAYLHEEQSCQISSQSDFNRRRIRLFELRGNLKKMKKKEEQQQQQQQQQQDD